MQEHVETHAPAEPRPGGALEPAAGSSGRRWAGRAVRCVVFVVGAGELAVAGWLVYGPVFAAFLGVLSALVAGCTDADPLRLAAMVDSVAVFSRYELQLVNG